MFRFLLNNFLKILINEKPFNPATYYTILALFNPLCRSKFLAMTFLYISFYKLFIFILPLF